jgi:crotonobetainyl-CoA:carnitine CoA-transferase CaiB-like acyl-CoA transferase
MAMLDGIRVVELGTAITAPHAAMLIADLGADVIKVERPGGDPYRHFPGMSPQFAASNRNKRAVVCDLTTAAGQEAFWRLLATADIFIENLRPGVLERMGFAPAELARRFPRLIHCSVTGFGTKGPYRDRPAFDGVVQALSGLTNVLGDLENAMVLTPPVAIGDTVAAMYATIAILGALHERTRTGQGVRLELNMLETSMAFMGNRFTAMDQDVEPDRLYTGASSQNFVLRCADDQLIAVHMSSPVKFWRTFVVEVLEAPELLTDERFRTRPDRVRRYRELYRELTDRFRRFPRAVWLERLSRADVPYGPVQGLVEVLNDAHVAAMGTLYEVENDLGAPHVGVQPPLLVNGRRPVAMRPAPELDEHRELLEDHSVL